MPAEIAFLRRHGVAFQQLEVHHGVRERELAAAGRYGGSSVSRSLHLRDMTGLAISQALTNQTIERNVTVLPTHWLLDLLMSADGCEGAVLLDLRHDALCLVRAGAVVLATGGGACMYPARSVADDKCATGVACALRAGAAAIDMEMVQFHPTGLRNDDGPGNGALLEEELRTQGGVLLNDAGERFMLDVDDRAELATRDIVARAIFTEMEGGGAVTLDLGAFEPQYLAQRFPNTVRRLRPFGVDLLSQPRVPVTPSAHFLMGGVTIDANAETEIARLLACGEDAGGVHGANRMGGNGVADALVFGAVAGRRAARVAAAAGARSPIEALAPVRLAVGRSDAAHAAMADLRTLMWRHCSPVRTTAGLARLASRLEPLDAFADALVCDVADLGRTLSTCHAAELRAVNAADNALLVARSIVAAARWRRASVGSHFLADGDPTWAGRRQNSRVRLASRGSNRLRVGGTSRDPLADTLPPTARRVRGTRRAAPRRTPLKPGLRA